MSQETPSDITQISLHRKIAENLTAQVKSGKLKPGEKLPSERQIARQFRASRATVRTALQHLEQSGLITRRERRSALVSIRRDITPYIRIACTSQHLVTMMERLSEMQMLPPRCQVQLVDLQQTDAVSRLTSFPSAQADFLICEWEYINGFRKKDSFYSPVPQSELADVNFLPLVQNACTIDKQFFAIPIGISPLLLYIQKSRLGEAPFDADPLSWSWDQFEQITSQLSGMGMYGLQFRPGLTHLAALMFSRGGQLFRQDGRIDATAPLFNPTLRWIYQMIHVDKVVPLLAKAGPINLFAEKRCATALDHFENYTLYRRQLGDDLRLGFLPRRQDTPGVFTGFAAVVMPGMENTQPAMDLLRKLLSANTQRLMIRLSAALPVRSDVLNLESLMAENIPQTHANLLINEIQRCQSLNLPDDLDHKIAVENLLLELWLGLDHLDNLCQRFAKL